MKRIIIVTGASSGLGREFSLQLAGSRSADEIWLLSRRRDRLEQVARELASGPVVPRVIEIDLTKTESLSAFAGLLKAERDLCGPNGFEIDALVNNAGFGTYGPFAETDAGRQLEMIDLNVYALTSLCHSALPYLSRGSLIINIASLASFIPLGNFAVYGATKAYVLSFSTALAAEVADSGIFVATVCPGPVDTEFALVASNGARSRVVDGEDPAAVVAHCLKAVRHGRRFSIMAFKWKLKAFLSRFVGRFAYARFSYIHHKRPSK